MSDVVSEDEQRCDHQRLFVKPHVGEFIRGEACSMMHSYDFEHLSSDRAFFVAFFRYFFFRIEKRVVKALRTRRENTRTQGLRDSSVRQPPPRKSLGPSHSCHTQTRRLNPELLLTLLVCLSWRQKRLVLAPYPSIL